jgi:hypothetical protein
MDDEALSQRKEYDQVINERDILGTQLIRRNDELALLYEKVREGTLINLIPVINQAFIWLSLTFLPISSFPPYFSVMHSHLLPPSLPLPLTNTTSPPSHTHTHTSNITYTHTHTPQLRVQQSALKAGEVHYAARVDDIRVLKIKIKVTSTYTALLCFSFSLCTSLYASHCVYSFLNLLHLM